MMIDKNLYQQIIQIMPISCVDIIVADNDGQVLLARRANDPVKGEWWFPGGRVHYLETRVNAVIRKLKDECGLDLHEILELGTFDVVAESSDGIYKSHAITTLYLARMVQHTTISLDYQHSHAEWRLPQDWLKLKLHPFIKQALTVYTKYNENFMGSI